MNNELYSIFYNDEIETYRYKYISISEQNSISVTPLQYNIIFCHSVWVVRGVSKH